MTNLPITYILVDTCVLTQLKSQLSCVIMTLNQAQTHARYPFSKHN